MYKQVIFSILILGLIIGCTELNSIKENETYVIKDHSTMQKVTSPNGDVVGKLVVGYQGWFVCSGDGSPINSWTHWSAGTMPSAGNQTFELWPDTREYSQTYQTGYANLGNNYPATLFSSYNDDVVYKHFKWMKMYGIDCVALQRFGHSLSIPNTKAYKDGIATKVKNAAQTYGRKFYIMYDISSWTNFQTEIKTDWTNTIKDSLNLTSSSAYAMQNGKPVVCIWGIGVLDRPGNVTTWKDVIDWFKQQGCYVIIGVPKLWRSDATNLPAYNSANMISPWSVGSFKGIAGADSYVSILLADKAYCDTLNIDFQPVVFPGFSWSNWNGGAQNDYPRTHGDFMWKQFYNLRNNGIANSYVAMFDEYDEGTAICKAAENSSMIPTDQYFLTLDVDGVACSSDFYLRLTGDGARMLNGTTTLVTSHPTMHLNYLDRCDTKTGWSSSNTLIVNPTTTDRKDGNACLESQGSGTDDFRKVFSPGFNSGARISTGYLTFWYYVSDISKFGTLNQVELGSGGKADVNEYSWPIGTLVNGWNRIELPFNSANITGGAPNLNSINWFRIYHQKTGSVTTRIDGIQIIP